MPAIDYIQTLVDYIEDIKPYHTKIFGVGVEYRVEDLINVTLEESLDINYGLGVDKAIPGYVKAATTTALPSYVAAGSGATKTLTASSVGILTVDDINLEFADQVLVKNQGSSHVDNGLYNVTTEGDASTAFVLTRTADEDGVSLTYMVHGFFVCVGFGTVNGDRGYVLRTPDPITIDVTPLNFERCESMIEKVHVTVLESLEIDGERIDDLEVGSTANINAAATICECVLILDGVGFDDEPEGYDSWDFDNVQAVRRFGHECVDGLWDYNSWDGTTLYYINEQPVSSTTWVVVHNLNITSLEISNLINTFDDFNIEIFYNNIVINDPSTFTLTFDTPQTGVVHFYFGHLWDQTALQPTFGRVVLGPQDLPVTNPDTFISYTHVQAAASNTWTINHNTNNYPLEIRSFDAGMAQMFDGTVFHTNRETSIVTFPSPRTGEAWVLSTVETEQDPGPEKC